MGPAQGRNQSTQARRKLWNGNSHLRDPRVLSAQDTRYSDERWYSIGNVGKRIIYVAHTIENEGQTNETIRIISARKASARERRGYQADAATDLGADDGKSSG